MKVVILIKLGGWKATRGDCVTYRVIVSKTETLKFILGKVFQKKKKMAAKIDILTEWRKGFQEAD